MNNNDIPELQSIWDEAKGYIDRGEVDKAADIYKYILIRYADSHIAVEHANAYLGDLFLTNRNLDLAEDYLKKAIELAPRKAHYHYLLGFTYSMKERWTKAIAQFRRAIELNPNDSEYERGLGWAMFNNGDKIEGLRHLKRALELYPSNIHAVTDLAGAMLMLGDLDKAGGYAREALKEDPGYGLAQELLDTIDRIRKKLR
jgi:Flp pilus assembly protein TadD